MEPVRELLLEALTPLGFRVCVTRERWALITTAKHPVMAGREDVVKATLEGPEQIRQSRSDPEVLLSTALRDPAVGYARWRSGR